MMRLTRNISSGCRVVPSVLNLGHQQLFVSSVHVMLPFAKHFKQHTFSDCELLIQSRGQEGPAEGRACKRARIAADNQQVASFPAHQIILCALEYFNAQAHNWQSASTSNSESSSHQQETKANKLVLNLTISSADRLPAAEAVIATLYGVQNALVNLRDDQLVQALIIADMIGAAEAAKMAGNRLRRAAKVAPGLSSSALEILAGLSAWPDCLLQLVPVIASNASCCSTGISDLAAVRAADGGSLMQRILLSVFGDLQSVWRDTRLRKLLMKLPCAAVQLLLSSDQLQVPSEDIVLYTAQWYADKQSDNPAKAAVVKSALAGLVRAPHLSDTMLHYAALSDVSPSFVLEGHLKQIRQLLLLRRILKDQKSDDFQTELTLFDSTPDSWRLGQRQIVATAPATAIWKLPVQELKEACQKAFRDKTKEVLQGPLSTPLSGLAWTMELDCEAGVAISVSVGLYKVPANYYVAFNFAVLCTGICGKRDITCLPGGDYAWDIEDYFGVGAMPGGWDDTAWAAKGLPTIGDLVLELEVSNVV